MAVQLLIGVRERVHPLHHLRRWPPFARWVMPLLDRPVAARMHGVDWPVQVRRIQHLSYIVDNRVLEPGVVAAFLAVQKLLRPRVFWDVGANIGFYSWLMMSADPQLKAVVFEPDPDTAGLVRKTIANADLSRVELIERAASAELGQAEFIQDGLSSATSHLAGSGTGARGRRILVPTTTLDHELTVRGAPDLVKIDVEGAEARVLDGARTLIREAGPVIIIECLDGARAPALAGLVDAGYALINADDVAADLTDATNFLCLPKAIAHRAEEIRERAAGERRRWLHRA